MSSQNRPGTPNAARGIVIVVAAGVIGIALLARGGSSELLAAGKPSHGQVTTTTAPVPTIASSTSVTIPATTTPPAQVSVSIYNATGGANQNAAGDNKAKLTPLGYTQVSIADTTASTKSAVYYAKGSETDANAIAQALGIDSSLVSASANASDLPTGAANAAVIVIIGKDSVKSAN